jgi:hypothetical protein
MTMRDHLRTVRIEALTGRPFTLSLYNTGETDDMGKSRLAYVFTGPEGVVFEGSDFRCSPAYAIDSDGCLRSLLGFLTLHPGDTDPEYFDSYTPEQLAYCANDAEWLSVYADEDSTEPLVNVENQPAARDQ